MLKENKKVLEARKALDEANEAQVKALNEYRDGRKAAAEAAEKAYATKLDEKLSSNVKAKELNKKMEDLEGQLKAAGGNVQARRGFGLGNGLLGGKKAEPKADPKAEPKSDKPKTDSKSDASKTDTSKTDTSKTDASKSDTTTDSTKTDAPKTDTTKTDKPKSGKSK